MTMDELQVVDAVQADEEMMRTLEDLRSKGVLTLRRRAQGMKIDMGSKEITGYSAMQPLVVAIFQKKYKGLVPFEGVEPVLTADECKVDPEKEGAVEETAEAPAPAAAPAPQPAAQAAPPAEKTAKKPAPAKKAGAKKETSKAQVAKKRSAKAPAKKEAPKAQAAPATKTNGKSSLIAGPVYMDDDDEVEPEAPSQLEAVSHITENPPEGVVASVDFSEVLRQLEEIKAGQQNFATQEQVQALGALTAEVHTQIRALPQVLTIILRTVQGGLHLICKDLRLGKQAKKLFTDIEEQVTAAANAGEASSQETEPT